MFNKLKINLEKIKFASSTAIIESFLLIIVSFLGALCVFVIFSVMKESYDLLNQRRIALNGAVEVISLFQRELDVTSDVKNSLISLSKDELVFVDSKGIARTFKCADNDFVFDGNVVLKNSVRRCAIRGFDENGKQTRNKDNVVNLELYLSVEADNFGLFSMYKDVWFGKKNYYEKFAEN